VTVTSQAHSQESELIPIDFSGVTYRITPCFERWQNIEHELLISTST